MKVILLNNIKKLGSRFEVIDVADGFAQNFLIPQKKVLPATLENLANIESIKSDQAASIAQEREEAEATIKKLEGVVLHHTALANEQGGLYESITTSNISEFLEKQVGVDLNETYIVLGEPIKKTGEFEITCAHESVSAVIKLLVSSVEDTHTK